MKILSMTATFGKLEHQTLTLQPGLNIIEAPNEWGKSTWCAFLAAMLYGIDTRVKSTKTALADKERYAPWSGSPMSGRMELDTGEDAISALEAALPGFGSKDFYRITLTGSGAGSLEEIREHFQHIPNLELRDKRREKEDLWAGAGEDTLQGAYFQQLKDAMEGSDEDTRRRIELAAEISRKLLEGREVQLP